MEEGGEFIHKGIPVFVVDKGFELNAAPLHPVDDSGFRVRRETLDGAVKAEAAAALHPILKGFRDKRN